MNFFLNEPRKDLTSLKSIQVRRMIDSCRTFSGSTLHPRLVCSKVLFAVNWWMFQKKILHRKWPYHICLQKSKKNSLLIFHFFGLKWSLIVCLNTMKTLRGRCLCFLNSLFDLKKMEQRKLDRLNDKLITEMLSWPSKHSLNIQQVILNRANAWPLQWWLRYPFIRN